MTRCCSGENDTSDTSDSRQNSSEVDREFLKRRRDYTRILRQLEAVKNQRVCEEEECENLRCVLDKELQKKREMKEKLHKLQLQVSEIQDRKKTLRATSKCEIETAQNELDKTKEYNKKLSCQVIQDKQTLQELQAEFRIEISNSRLLEEKKSCLERQVKKVKCELEADEECLEKTTCALEKLKIEVQKKDDFLTALKQKVAIAEDEKHSIEHETRASEDKLACLRDECRKIHCEKCQAQEALLNVKFCVKNAVKELEDAKSALSKKRREQKVLKCKISEREIELRRLQGSKHQCYVCEAPLADGH